ncbi:MAG TPA: aminoacyl-tRNA hydrolase [Cyanobacteria bacterium UBA8156]|jgi:PTH1 family peptidyl-tRNA hydrolase|nr:aminoacyl-tRNA hydrolase [Cyanobacteria bacterium UBA8156]
MPEAVPLRAIVGLGNPGPQYAQTRHNIGFMVLERLAQRWGAIWREEKRFKGTCAEGGYQGRKIWLLKPQTYMNASGEAAIALLQWHKLPRESLLVVYDDLDLPFGKLRLRANGSAGGHNGIKSCLQHLGGDGFGRLRLGIGRAGDRETVAHVLGTFRPEEASRLPELLNLATAAIETAIARGLPQAMNEFNAQGLALMDAAK